MVLVAGAALFTRTLQGLGSQGPGFKTTSLVSFVIRASDSGYSLADANRLLRRLNELLSQAPTTEQSAAVRVTFLKGGSWNNPMTIRSVSKKLNGLICSR
ncbi:MAG: hypothetical protein ACJ746_07560 [Bryobacteraceae bacterium]